MNNIENYGITNNISKNNHSMQKQIGFKAQFNAADLKLLAKDIQRYERDVDLTMIYTLVKYLKELPGKCAKFVKGKTDSPKSYLYELHIDNQKVAVGRTFSDNSGEACREALINYTTDVNPVYNNLKHRIGWDELQDMYRENSGIAISDLLKLAIK